MDGWLEDAGGGGQGEEFDGQVIIGPLTIFNIIPATSLNLRVCCIHFKTGVATNSLANIPVPITVLVDKLEPTPLFEHSACVV